MSASSFITIVLIVLGAAAWAGADEPARTTFQIHVPWSPRRDYQADAAIIYGIDATFADRLKSFAAQGYRAEFMTGVAWGQYGDYIEGKFDGQNHIEDAQVRRDGSRVMHDPVVPYMVPSPPYRAYLKTKLTQAIDAGATAIYLEEPEYWAFAGYEASFKREYRGFYREDWRPPHESVDARFRVDHLKYVLYRDTLEELFSHAKEYAASKGTSVRCYVPTHSLISYAQIRMVSPMSSLMGLKNCDGYIAQVWTGTARHPNTLDGVTRERTFETAYFEYAQMTAMTRPSGRTCYFLADPIEDDPNHGWDDYEANYKRTLVASLMHPETNHYEICPWPNRVFEANYFATEKDARSSAEVKAPRVPISDDYASVLLACFNALAEMPGIEAARWEARMPGVGVLVSDSLMFQRDEPTPSDPHLNSFFALALPLLEAGVPARVVQMETLDTPDALAGVEVLLMTYEGMKPLEERYHGLLAEFVRAGGELVVVDDQDDPYNAMRAWWNAPPLAHAAPLEHLFAVLKAPLEAGTHAVGRGHVTYLRQSPARLAKQAAGADAVRALLSRALSAAGMPALAARSDLQLRRGPFVVAANLEESPAAREVTITGSFVDLFDARLPVVVNPPLKGGEVKLYRRLERSAAVLASSSRISRVSAGREALSFESRGPAGTTCRTRLSLPGKPGVIEVARDGKPVAHESEWDPASSTLLLRHENQAAPVRVTVRLTN